MTSGPTFYAPGSGYIGFNAGKSDFSVGGGSGLFSSEKKDTAYNIYGGTYFNPNFGLEAGFTDFGKINRRRAHVIATPLQDARDIDAGAEFLPRRLAHLTAFDQAGLGSGAAHIERKQIVAARELAEMRGSNNPRRRAGLDYAAGNFCCRGAGNDAAI